MSETKEDGGPAFPRDRDIYRGGLTLRDYFAAKALQASIMVTAQQTYEDAAADAYGYADAMLEARKA